jgi:hypothetical protein
MSKAETPRTSHSWIYCPKHTKRKRKIHLKAVNNEQLVDNMAVTGQLSFQRRRTVKMCGECLTNRHHLCSKDECPCLCNDPQTVRQRQPIRGEVPK